jgi:hypothetical protein
VFLGHWDLEERVDLDFGAALLEEAERLHLFGELFVSMSSDDFLDCGWWW